MNRRFVAAASALLLAGCADSMISVVCPEQPDPAVAVFVVDGADARSLASQARGWYVVEARVDSLRFRTTPLGEALVAEGPPGIYRIEVVVEGHVPWRAEAVHVAAGACGASTTRLTATPVPRS
jgi:hypothetical protein